MVRNKITGGGWGGEAKNFRSRPKRSSKIMQIFGSKSRFVILLMNHAEQKNQIMY